MLECNHTSKRQLSLISNTPLEGEKAEGTMSKEEIIKGAKVVNLADMEQNLRHRTRAVKPENQALVDKASTLKIGQGFKIPSGMLFENEVTAANGKVYTLQGYRAYNLIRKIEGKKFSTRRDSAGNMYLFRIAA